MNYSQKAAMSKNIKNFNMILICVIGSISILGLVMCLYSLVHLKLLFSLIYLVAVLLGFSYVIMRINTIMPTYIASNHEYLYVQNWENGIFPFKINQGLVGEFIPEKTVLKKIDISAISKIYLGSRNYLLKLLEGGELREFLSSPDNKYDSMLKKMEFLYIKTVDNKEIYMSVTDFDKEEIAMILKPITDEHEKIDFRCNNRVICKLIPSKKIVL